MSYEESKTNGEEAEILSGEHEKVRGMCGGLKRVNAPKNFDFHLKARIANCDPNEFKSNAFLPFLRYALPLCVVLLLAGFVVFSGILIDNQSATLAETSPTVQAENSTTNSENVVAKTLPAATISNASSPSANAEPQKATSNAEFASITNKISIANSANKKTGLSEDFGGTRESTSRDSKILTPKGFPSIQTPVSNQSVNMKSQNSISVKSAFSGIGIEAEFVNPNWRVKSVAANSLAMRSGLKSGDLIEAADDRKLDSETISEQSLTIKTLHVLREGKKIVVELK